MDLTPELTHRFPRYTKNFVKSRRMWRLTIYDLRLTIATIAADGTIVAIVNLKS